MSGTRKSTFNKEVEKSMKELEKIMGKDLEIDFDWLTGRPLRARNRRERFRWGW